MIHEYMGTWVPKVARLDIPVELGKTPHYIDRPSLDRFVRIVTVCGTCRRRSSALLRTAGNESP